jgi:hypothetical protein
VTVSVVRGSKLHKIIEENIHVRAFSVSRFAICLIRPRIY